MLSAHNDVRYAERALRAGAKGYVVKSDAGEVIVNAITDVLDGETYISPTLNDQVAARLDGRKGEVRGEYVDALSDRELEIFELYGQGVPRRDIATRLGIAPKTVDTHQTHIKRKLGLSSAADLMRSAIEWTRLPPA